MNMNKDKLLSALVLLIVFALPMHFKFKRSRNDNMHTVQFGLQWFGYAFQLGLSWADMSDMYRDRIEGND